MKDRKKLLGHREWTHIAWLYGKVFLLVCIKATLLIAFFPLSQLETIGNYFASLYPPKYRIYEDSVAEYLWNADYLENVFYIQVGDDAQDQQVFAQLQNEWVVAEFEQPFTGLDMPYYRVEFSGRDDVIKRTLAILRSNGTVKDIMWVPRFEIQQSFMHYKRVWPDRKLVSKPVRFTTQQLEDKDFEWQWYLDEIWLTKDNLTCLDASWPKIKVAIIDNAFVETHPSFNTSVEKIIDVADGDTNVRPPEVSEEWMHGSHSAWLIAGKKFANKWIIGTSLWSAELYLLKATSDESLPSEISHGIEAFAKAVELDVDVISLSWGAYMDFPIFRQIVQKALDKGIVIIAAAGNYWSDEPFYPAAYEQVISVGSFDANFARSVFSNYGSWVDVYAPGENLVVPDSEDGFAKTDGTSAAAPLFAGIYALVMRHTGIPYPDQILYAKKTQESTNVSLAELCTETWGEAMPTGQIQQVAAAPLEQAPVAEEHTVAPVEEVPSYREQLTTLVRMRGWWILASILLVTMGLVVLLRQKQPPVSSGDSV